MLIGVSKTSFVWSWLDREMILKLKNGTHEVTEDFELRLLAERRCSWKGIVLYL